MTKLISKAVIGIDEVGRGPLAGPVTVCAVYLSDPIQAKKKYFGDTIRDSKKLSLSLRNNIYQTIRENKKNNNVVYAVSSRSAEHIDKHGINNSIHACMVSCLNQLKKQGIETDRIQINLDGGLKIKNLSANRRDNSLQQSSFIKGDENYTEIALASIMAKVTRDKYMVGIAKKFSGYGFENNVGYGTREHVSAIKKLGITKHHRKSYLSRIITIR